MKGIKQSLATLVLAASAGLQSCSEQKTPRHDPCDIFRATLFTSGDVNYDRGYAESRELSLDNFAIAMGDDHSIVDKCGFDYLNDETRGGYGHTLDIIGGPEGSVYMQWIGGGLTRICVRTIGDEGWGGKTDKGLKIGDPFTKFIALYPEAQQQIPDLYTLHAQVGLQQNIWTDGNFKVSVVNSGIERIASMEISFFTYAEYPFIAGLPIGPGGSENELWH